MARMTERPHTDDIVVSARDVTKDYGGDAGVFDLDLDISRGSIVGFIGPSGSGKTTTVRMLTGIIATDEGRIEVLGESPIHFTSATRARIGYMPQQALLFPDLSLKENLDFAASLYGMPYNRSDRISELVEFVELEGAIDRLPDQASGGEKRRAMLAATLIHSPDLIFLDEPTAGLDPVLRRKLWDRFRDLAENGRTLLVTTQYVGEAAYCDYVAVLAEGRVLILDTPEGLRRAAYGGELVEVVLARRPTREDEASLAALSTGADPTWLDYRTVRLTVDDAGTAGPEIASWASDRDVEIEKSEAFQPEFDDVFVELVDKLSNEPAGKHVDVG